MILDLTLAVNIIENDPCLRAYVECLCEYIAIRIHNLCVIYYELFSSN